MSQLSQTDPRDVLYSKQYVQCDKLAIAIGQTKFTALATTGVPWRKSSVGGKVSVHGQLSLFLDIPEVLFNTV